MDGVWAAGRRAARAIRGGKSEADEQHKRRERAKLDALLGWCEVTECRRRPLLEYFDEARAEPCGNCDNCTSPPATWDGTDAARKLLSAVYRTGQTFGAAHVIDVLLGQATEKVARHRHERLSVFGIGSDVAAASWRSLLRQLLVLGYVRVDHEGYGALALTEASRALLRGETTVRVREDTKAPATRKARRARGERASRRPTSRCGRRCANAGDSWRPSTMCRRT